MFAFVSRRRGCFEKEEEVCKKEVAERKDQKWLHISRTLMNGGGCE